MNSDYDFYYECTISDDVMWLLYYKENNIIQDGYEIRENNKEKDLAELLIGLKSLQRKWISTICHMTEKPGTAIPVQNIIDDVYQVDKAPQPASFGKNIRNLKAKFDDAGQKLRIIYKKNDISGDIIVSGIEKRKIQDAAHSDEKKPISHNGYIIKEKNIDGIQNLTNRGDSDDYYINVIKERALSLTGDDTLVELRALERKLFKMRCENLSKAAKEEIDDFFAFDLRAELVKNGVSETLAALYCEIWLLWGMRLQYKADMAEMENSNEHARLELRREGLGKIEFRLDEATNIVMFYNQSLEKGGKM